MLMRQNDRKKKWSRKWRLHQIELPTLQQWPSAQAWWQSLPQSTSCKNLQLLYNIMTLLNSQRSSGQMSVIKLCVLQSKNKIKARVNCCWILPGSLLWNTGLEGTSGIFHLVVSVHTCAWKTQSGKNAFSAKCLWESGCFFWPSASLESRSVCLPECVCFWVWEAGQKTNRQGHLEK